MDEITGPDATIEVVFTHVLSTAGPLKATCGTNSCAPIIGGFLRSVPSISRLVFPPLILLIACVPRR